MVFLEEICRYSKAALSTLFPGYVDVFMCICATQLLWLPHAASCAHMPWMSLTPLLTTVSSSSSRRRRRRRRSGSGSGSGRNKRT